MAIKHPTSPSRVSRGFSLVEMILYIAILSIVVGTLVQTGVSLLNSMVYMRANEEVAQSATMVLERLTRELRFASSVSLGASTLTTHPGTLVLNTINASNNPTTVTFDVQGDRVMLTEGAGAAAPLTHDTVTVTNLVFTRSTSAESEGVRVDLTLERVVRNQTIVKTFRTFVVLDAS